MFAVPVRYRGARRRAARPPSRSRPGLRCHNAARRKRHREPALRCRPRWSGARRSTRSRSRGRAGYCAAPRNGRGQHVAADRHREVARGFRERRFSTRSGGPGRPGTDHRCRRFHRRDAVQRHRRPRHFHQRDHAPAGQRLAAASRPAARPARRHRRRPGVPRKADRRRAAPRRAPRGRARAAHPAGRNECRRTRWSANPGQPVGVALFLQGPLDLGGRVEMVVQRTLAPTGDDQDVPQPGPGRLRHDQLDRRGVDDRPVISSGWPSWRAENGCPGRAVGMTALVTVGVDETGGAWPAAAEGLDARTLTGGGGRPIFRDALLLHHLSPGDPVTVPAGPLGPVERGVGGMQEPPPQRRFASIDRQRRSSCRA